MLHCGNTRVPRLRQIADHSTGSRGSVRVANFSRVSTAATTSRNTIDSRYCRLVSPSLQTDSGLSCQHVSSGKESHCCMTLMRLQHKWPPLLASFSFSLAKLEAASRAASRSDFCCKKLRVSSCLHRSLSQPIGHNQFICSPSFRCSIQIAANVIKEEQLTLLQ